MAKKSEWIIWGHQDISSKKNQHFHSFLKVVCLHDQCQKNPMIQFVGNFDFWQTWVIWVLPEISCAIKFFSSKRKKKTKSLSISYMEKIGKIFIFMQKIGKSEGPILEKVVTEGQSAICAMMCYAVIINY